MDYKNTYCNPIKIEDYPKGYELPSYRSLADPSVLFYDGKWYMYPSYKMVYVTEDFVNWEHIDILPNDIGYAPTVVEHNGKIYLYGKNSLFVSDSPLGPFENLGALKFDDGTPLRVDFDAMIFSDDDGRVYLYYANFFGVERKNKKGNIDNVWDVSIWGAELDSNDLTRVISPEKCLIKFDNTHRWECYGTRNQNTANSWVEGPWMVKRNGRYYLTYSAPGTHFSTYAMGVYYSDEGPLEGFVYQKNNPICNKNHGLISGGGHGCITEGPNDTLWAFYTCPVNYSHRFERFLGMDPVTITEDGEMVVLENTESPQWAPGVKKDPYFENDTGLLPLTISETAYASSVESGRDAIYAVDESVLTWWQPKTEDEEKSLTVLLDGLYDVSAARIIWRDVGLDFEHGNLPGPFKYKIQISLDEENWTTVLDKSQNDKDLKFDYNVFPTTDAKFVRLTICGHPKNIQPGVINFTVFGKYSD